MESVILHNIRCLSFSVVYKCRRIPSFDLKYTLTSLSSKVDRGYTCISFSSNLKLSLYDNLPEASWVAMGSDNFFPGTKYSQKHIFFFTFTHIRIYESIQIRILHFIGSLLSFGLPKS